MHLSENIYWQWMLKGYYPAVKLNCINYISLKKLKKIMSGKVINFHILSTWLN